MKPLKTGGYGRESESSLRCTDRKNADYDDSLWQMFAVKQKKYKKIHL